jgi:hypothetical protein
VQFSRPLGAVRRFFVDDCKLEILHFSRCPQLNWLDQTLQKNKELKTIIFNHGPLINTVENPKLSQNSWAQPWKDIDAILSRNSQVVAWISGHTHTCPTNNTFISPINIYQKRIINIHNCDLRNRPRHWITELVIDSSTLYINVFDEIRNKWDNKLSRSISLANV